MAAKTFEMLEYYIDLIDLKGMRSFVKKLRQRITPARWRKIHFGLLGTVACLLLLYLGMEGSVLDGIPILAALVLIVVDFIGDILFFRCPYCGAFLQVFWSGYCHSCGEYIDFTRDT